MQIVIPQYVFHLKKSSKNGKKLFLQGRKTERTGSNRPKFICGALKPAFLDLFIGKDPLNNFVVFFGWSTDLEG